MQRACRSALLYATSGTALRRATLAQLPGAHRHSVVHSAVSLKHAKCIRRRVLTAANERGAAEEVKQTSAAPTEDMPVWERRETERKLQASEPQDLPFGLYLLFSVIVAIAAVRVGCL